MNIVGDALLFNMKNPATNLNNKLLVEDIEIRNITFRHNQI
jgi:hypothetical protein